MSIPKNINREHLIKAIEKVDKEGIPQGSDSQSYDVLYNGKKYPPKVIVSYANIFANGSELNRNHFGGGLNQPSFKLLKKEGFDIIFKDMPANQIMNNKEKFKVWLEKKYPNTGTTSSYIRALDILQNSFLIWENNNEAELSNVLTEVELNQQNEDGKFYNADASSYGMRLFYSAALKQYIKFLESIKVIPPAIPSVTPAIKFEVQNFQRDIKNAGLLFSNQLIWRFIASLCTKPFVICSGLSGSGKTKLAQAFAQWITADKSQYEIVPVGADWTNREPLLGYPNALRKEEYIMPENGVLTLMMNAKQNFEDEKQSIKPYFLILDEMNLSHVERYFADFLSTMESDDEIPLHKISNEVKRVPEKLKLPPNLFIIGTVNIDETTYMFSPKVLDRANTIEFRLSENDLQEYIDSDVLLNMDLLIAQGANMSESFMAMALQKTDKNLKHSKHTLIEFFSELKKSGAEFGYRTANEIGRLMYMLLELGESDDNLLDIAIMQKLLPKLHGSRNKLTKVLPVLGGFCLLDKSKIKEVYLDKFVSNIITEADFKRDANIKYKISFEKICRMYKNAIENGFASYAEA